MLIGSFCAVAEQNQNSHLFPPKYTTDLSPWGPLPETSLKFGPAEPRWMALQEAEQEKVMECIDGREVADHVMFTLAVKEVTLDRMAKAGKTPRGRPVGELADEVFREMVEYEIGNYVGTRDWPLPHRHGHEIARMYGHHFGYQFWREYYDYRIVDPFGTSFGEELRKKIYEQF